MISQPFESNANQHPVLCMVERVGLEPTPGIQIYSLRHYQLCFYLSDLVAGVGIEPTSFRLMRPISSARTLTRNNKNNYPKCIRASEQNHASYTIPVIEESASMPR